MINQKLLHLCDDYVRKLEILRYSRKTVQEIRRMLRSFCLWLDEHYGVASSDGLSPEALQDYHRFLSARKTRDGYPLKATTVNRYLIAIRGFLEHLAKEQLIRHALIEALPYLKEPQRLPGNVLDHCQVKKLLANIRTCNGEGYRNRAMLELLYSTGIRANELLSLDLADIDQIHKTALINGKGRKQRMVPIGMTALRYLETYIRAVRPFLVRENSEKALFLNLHGNRLSYERFRCILVAVMEEAGVDEHVTAHTFRRSCTTELIRSGANMYHVKELLGHESLETLKHYARLTITDLKKTHRKCHPREKDL